MNKRKKEKQNAKFFFNTFRKHILWKHNLENLFSRKWKLTTAKPNKQLLSLSFCNYPSSNIQSGGLPCRTGSSSGISLTRELMNGQLKDGGARLLMPVIKCKIRGDGKGGTRPRRGERRVTNYKLGKYDSWTERERERGGKGCCSLARLTKRLFPHPALIPKLNHSAENQACSRFMQINDTLQRVNVPRYFITMGARAKMHHKHEVRARVRGWVPRMKSRRMVVENFCKLPGDPLGR